MTPMQEKLRALARLQPAGPRLVPATRYGVGNLTVYNGGAPTPEARHAAANRAWYQANRDEVLAAQRRKYRARTGKR